MLWPAVARVLATGPDPFIDVQPSAEQIGQGTPAVWMPRSLIPTRSWLGCSNSVVRTTGPREGDGLVAASTRCRIPGGNDLILLPVVRRRLARPSGPRA